MSEEFPKPVPVPDRDSQPFWEGVRVGELRVQSCDDCGLLRWPPRDICGGCHAFSWHWRATTGRGTVLSWVVNHQVFSPSFATEVPYTVVTVAINEQSDIQMVGGWCGAGAPRAGMAVRAVYTRFDEETTLVNWEPVDEAPDSRDE
ncbi:OB-fold domain-containing protein [Myxococcota bacterium]|nr:OB-fold domain-containing protein [Myxococcota bacterium]